MSLTATPDPLRRDARDNREAIIRAARELFADSSAVAMAQVARRAGVGQGTLSRNFPSRGALAAELLDEHVDRIATLATAQAGEPDAFFVLLRALVDGMVNLYGSRCWPARHRHRLAGQTQPTAGRRAARGAAARRQGGGKPAPRLRDR